MKRETFRHPKLLDLMSRLNCSRPEAIGFLTLLWDFTAEYAIQGDIGKHADGAIAGACEYRGDPATFINALIDSRWIDRDDDYRLLVHHWFEHCERWVKLKMEKLHKPFIKPFADRSAKPSTEASIEQAVEPTSDVTNPIQSNPIQPVTVDRFDDFFSKYPKRVKGKPAREIWKRKKLDSLADQIIQDVAMRLSSDRRWLDGFIPDPTTYLNQERWNDEIDNSPPGGKPTSNSATRTIGAIPKGENF